MAKAQIRTVSSLIRLLGFLSLWIISFGVGCGISARQTEVGVSKEHLTISCAPERPVVYSGESITVNVWVTDSNGKALVHPVHYAWEASVGTITGTDTATWSLGNLQANSKGNSRNTAKVTVQDTFLGQVVCEIQVFVAGLPSVEEQRLMSRLLVLEGQLQSSYKYLKELKAKHSKAKPIDPRSILYLRKLQKEKEKLQSKLNRNYTISPRSSKSLSELESDRSPRLSGRAFLLPNWNEPTGYGLYSYLLFDTPPRDDLERVRYLKALESYLLMLQPIEELEHYKRRSELNLTLIPVKRNIDLTTELSRAEHLLKAAEQMLAAYDYARASALLANIGRPPLQGGPFLVAMKPAAADSGTLYLFLDMSRVTPKLVWDWVRAFCALAAQTPTWGEVEVTKLALNTRNAIAVAARDTPEVLGALQQWIRVFKPGEKG